jgi:hypothetical protein
LPPWAGFNGYEASEAPIVGRTPLLRLDGERRHVHAVPTGPQGGVIYRYAYETGSGSDRESVDLIVVQTLPAAGFPHFRVEPRHGAPSGVSARCERDVELESAEFTERHRLTVDDRCAPERIRRLFEPDLIVWWLENAGDTLVECEMGTLVVGSTTAGSWADLDRLVEIARHVGERVIEAGLAVLRP